VTNGGPYVVPQGSHSPGPKVIPSSSLAVGESVLSVYVSDDETPPWTDK
jgi:hypothetical protein